MSDTGVSVSLASIPSRAHLLKRVVAGFLPQADVVHVYLNKYKDVPSFLDHPKVVVARSEDYGNRGDAGKFFWCENATGYQFTADDDIFYPSNYVKVMVAAIERYQRRAIVGLHGVTLPHQPVMRSYYKERCVFHCWHRQPGDVVVHILGTGVMAYHASAVSVLRSDFEYPNMADIWFGIVCQRQHVPQVCIARGKGFVRQLPVEERQTIYGAQSHNDTVQTEATRRVTWATWGKALRSSAPLPGENGGWYVVWDAGD